MIRPIHLTIALLLLALSAPSAMQAQSDDDNLSLGDLARSLRRSKSSPSKTIIDNDNLSKVMDEVSSRKIGSGLLFSLDGLGKSFQVSSPDVTCSLSFSAQAASLLTEPYGPRSLPPDELAKLEGPATINGDSLQLEVHNGTEWQLQEITVSITVLRPRAPAVYGPAPLALAATSTPLNEKRPDTTVLYHMKGAASPLTTAVFQETMASVFDPDQDWHWSIVEAKGTPPKPPAPEPPATVSSLSQN